MRRLCRTLGLTPAEGAVALSFARGAMPDRIAAERSTSRQTVSNQLKSIMAKMGVHERAELMREILRIVPEALADVTRS